MQILNDFHQNLQGGEQLLSGEMFLIPVKIVKVVKKTAWGKKDPLSLKVRLLGKNPKT